MDFLFEIGLEELPSRYVDETEANLKKIMTVHREGLLLL